MRNKRVPITGLITAIMLLITIVVGYCLRGLFYNDGLDKVDSIETLRDQNVGLAFALDSSFEEGYADNAKDGEVPYDNVDSAEIIAVASFTGNISYSPNAFGQEIIIEKIIRGSEYVSENKNYMVCQVGNFSETAEGIQYERASINIMDPSCEYLIFMNLARINEYQEEQVYLLASDDFGYIRTDKTQTPTLSENYEQYSLWDLKEYEFFSTSDQLTKMLNNIRAELLNLYL